MIDLRCSVALSFNRASSSFSTALADPFKIHLDGLDPVSPDLFDRWCERGIIIDIENSPAGIAIEVIMRLGAGIEPFSMGINIEFLNLSRLNELGKVIIHRGKGHSGLLYGYSSVNLFG
jgi:hypothetical protein